MFLCSRFLLSTSNFPNLQASYLCILRRKSKHGELTNDQKATQKIVFALSTKIAIFGYVMMSTHEKFQKYKLFIENHSLIC